MTDEHEPSPGEVDDATLLAGDDETRLAQRPGTLPQEPGIAPAPDPIRPAPSATGGTLLERHLGPPPTAGEVARADRGELPSLARRERRFRRVVLIGFGVTTLACGAGLWGLWLLW